MCYSNSSTSSNVDLGKKYGKKVDPSISDSPIYFASGFQFPMWRIISKEPTIQYMRWGLVPNWFLGKEEEIASKTLNARIETLSSKPSFQQLIDSNRCIIPSTGFFEWQHQGKNKIPHFIYGKEDTILSMAGLWDTYQDEKTGKILNSFTILTQPASPFMVEIHNVKKRMPVILDEDSIDLWLNSAESMEIVEKNKGVILTAHPVDKAILLSANSNVAESQMPFSSTSTQYSIF